MLEHAQDLGHGVNAHAVIVQKSLDAVQLLEIRVIRGCGGLGCHAASSSLAAAADVLVVCLLHSIAAQGCTVTGILCQEAAGHCWLAAGVLAVLVQLMSFPP